MTENLKILEVIKNIFFSSIKKYKYIFDKKIKNSTAIVALICAIIFWVIFSINNKINSNNLLQANIISTKKIKFQKNDNFIKIDWKIYKLILLEK